MDRAGRGGGGDRRGSAGVSDFVQFLESLSPSLVYASITAFAAVENLFPPVPADMAIALGAFLAGRGRVSPWTVFCLTWVANVASGAAVYALARRYGRSLFRGILGEKLFSEATVAHIERVYERYGSYGIFFSRLLPVWRSVVMPFAGIARISAPRALIPLALASGVYYGALTVLVSTLGTNWDGVARVLGRVNTVLAVIAAIPVVLVAAWVVRRLKR
jgi:membrane protein DedA with SNARE-associated domain